MDSKTREKVRNKLFGHIVSADTKKLISQALKGREKGKTHKNRIAESMKKYWKNKRLNNVDNERNKK